MDAGKKDECAMDVCCLRVACGVNVGRPEWGLLFGETPHPPHSGIFWHTCLVAGLCISQSLLSSPTTMPSLPQCTSRHLHFCFFTPASSSLLTMSIEPPGWNCLGSHERWMLGPVEQPGWDQVLENHVHEGGYLKCGSQA